MQYILSVVYCPTTALYRNFNQVEGGANLGYLLRKGGEGGGGGGGGWQYYNIINSCNMCIVKQQTHVFPHLKYDGW